MNKIDILIFDYHFSVFVNKLVRNSAFFCFDSFLSCLRSELNVTVNIQKKQKKEVGVWLGNMSRRADGVERVTMLPNLYCVVATLLPYVNTVL